MSEVEIVVPHETLYQLLVQGLPYKKKESSTMKAVRSAFVRFYSDYVKTQKTTVDALEKAITHDLEGQGFEVREFWADFRVKEGPRSGRFHRHIIAVAKKGELFSEQFAVFVCFLWDQYGKDDDKGTGEYEFEIFVAPYP